MLVEDPEPEAGRIACSVDPLHLSITDFVSSTHLVGNRLISYTVLMLFRSRRSAPVAHQPHPAERQGSYSSYQDRRRRRWRRGLFVVVLLVVLSVPLFLLAKTLRAYNSVMQKHSGVATEALKKPPVQAPDAKVEGEGRVNILLLGVGDANHAGSSLSDTMMVVSVDPESKDVAMLSLPRDLYVPIPDHGYDKINAAHAYGELKKAGEGPNLAKEVVGKVLDVPIHYYIRLDFTGFRKAIDTLGGVSIDVPTALSDPEYPCDKDEGRACGFAIKSGMQTMNGVTALKYARCRKGNCGNDFGRAARQQEVMLAMREKALTLSTLSNPGKLAALIDTVGSHVRTDLAPEELTRLAEVLKDVPKDKVVNKVIDETESQLVMTANIDGASVVVPKLGTKNYNQLQDFAHNLFFDRHIVSENLPVKIINASGSTKLGEEVAATLKAYRYNIVGVETGPTQAASQLTAVKIDKGSYTRRYLENRFAVTATETSDEDTPALVLVLGTDIKKAGR